MALSFGWLHLLGCGSGVIVVNVRSAEHNGEGKPM